ncbi:hypothetical protein TeGR_g8063 [Tetraparma gracilis]|uniref:VDE lipocalin domain-containing protein n=1 Tax=Tetraparma gracilis TaxID=2962635 RepID=A0ABQ6M8Z8_9STRA|nr:hypothetical protein TeGR_g8063 [Tetraparma gracilis]
MRLALLLLTALTLAPVQPLALQPSPRPAAPPQANILAEFRRDTRTDPPGNTDPPPAPPTRPPPPPSRTSLLPPPTPFSATLKHACFSALLSLSLLSPPSALPAFAENELLGKYGGGVHTDLVDTSCLKSKCARPAEACLVADPSCRKGLACIAKCLGSNECITGCEARYGSARLDDLLACTIEENECIKVAILPGGADAQGEEPRAPKATVAASPKALQGSWYKVIGFNPNYDCYHDQRNTFTPAGKDMSVAVKFSLPRLPDSPAPDAGPPALLLNDYATTERLVFDPPHELKGGGPASRALARTAHSEGRMFGLT